MENKEAIEHYANEHADELKELWALRRLNSPILFAAYPETTWIVACKTGKYSCGSCCLDSSSCKRLTLDYGNRTLMDKSQCAIRLEALYPYADPIGAFEFLL